MTHAVALILGIAIGAMAYGAIPQPPCSTLRVVWHVVPTLPHTRAE